MLKRDPHREMWDGPRIGAEQARVIFPVEHAHSLESIEVLADAMSRAAGVYHDISQPHAMVSPVLEVRAVLLSTRTHR